MNTSKLLLLSLGLLMGVATAQAHRVWILPATTVLSGTDQWVSFDTAVSNDLFFPNHRGISPEQVQAFAPDGSSLQLQNATGGKVRGTFELHLEQPGTYVISLKAGGPRGPMGGDALFGSYEENGKSQRWRGTAETLVSENMAAKPNFKLRENGGRTVITFVTLGSPSTELLQSTGQGLELDYITHPNDLFTGEPASFRVLLDGKPLADAEVAVVKGDDRYRDTSGEIVLKTDADGLVKITWPSAGRYWFEASSSVPSTFHNVPSEKTYTYIATYEVLPE